MMTKQEAIQVIKCNYPSSGTFEVLCEALDIAIECVNKCIEEDENPCNGCYDDDCRGCLYNGRLE